jgi:DNA-binding SARP family transcriptional activator
MHVAINEQVVKQNDEASVEDVVAVEELAKVALLAEKTGSLNRAEATWLELLARDEANSDNWAGYGRVMYRKGDTGRAYEAFKGGLNKLTQARPGLTAADKETN